MHILITGGAGYIGSHAVKLFLERGHDVWVYDSLVYGHRAAVPPDRLIVGESVLQPAKYWQNNVVNTLNLMECLRRQKIGRFVFSSTAATFGTPDEMPIAEATPQQPINPYGVTKLTVERALA